MDQMPYFRRQQVIRCAGRPFERLMLVVLVLLRGYIGKFPGILSIEELTSCNGENDAVNTPSVLMVYIRNTSSSESEVITHQ
jgi:hypothetical protein